MPQSVDAARVMQFADMTEAMFQQRMSRLKMSVQLKTGCIGTQVSFDLVGPSNMQDITGIRDGSTSWINVDHNRRWAPKSDFTHPVLLSRGDRLAAITDLQSAYLRNGVMAAGRQLDKLLIDAATGTAVTGETGGSTETFNTAAPATVPSAGGQQIAVGGTGLTIDKMRAVRGFFLAWDVGVDDLEMGTPGAFTWVTNGIGMQNLLSETEATNRDYVGETGGRLPLENGMIPRFLGFDIRVVNQLNLLSGDSINLAWHRDAMGLGIWSGSAREQAEMDGSQVTDSFVVTVDRLPEHNNARGVTVQGDFGAVRVQRNGVIAVVCDIG